MDTEAERLAIELGRGGRSATVVKARTGSGRRPANLLRRCASAPRASMVDSRCAQVRDLPLGMREKATLRAGEAEMFDGTPAGRELAGPR